MVAIGVRVMLMRVVVVMRVLMWWASSVDGRARGAAHSRAAMAARAMAASLPPGSVCR
jgi:hypothetical protein